MCDRLNSLTEEEQVITALPTDLQRRMAHLVLAGWRIYPVPGLSHYNYTRWVAVKYYADGTPPWSLSSSTLLTLLGKMHLVVEVELLKTPMPDAAERSRRMPGDPFFDGSLN